MALNKKLFGLFVSEFVGTALLLAIGLSAVILTWGAGSFVATLVPSVPLRRLLTGFLFGLTGCIVTLSPVGKISGAHINPAVSLAFWLRGKMKTEALAGYVISQMLGAVLGCLPLLLWHDQGKSIGYGITTPGAKGTWAAFTGEVLTTAALVTVIFIFVGDKRLRGYTPFTMPFLFGFMVWAETALSGCSTNPARSFGPAVISGIYTGYWIYIIAPVTGTLLAVAVFKWLRLHHYYHIESARISYHGHPSPQSPKTSSNR
jgi:aquaporin Z